MKSLRLELGIFMIVCFIFASCGASEAAEKAKIKFRTPPEAASVGYMLTFSLCNYINQTSQAIQAVSAEGAGSLGNIQVLFAKEDMRKDTVIFTDQQAISFAKQGFSPFKKKDPSIKVIARMFGGAVPLATLNPKIKTWGDLVGKKMIFAPPGVTDVEVGKLILKYGYGILEQVKYQNTGWGAGIDALMDGLVDAAPCLVVEQVIPAGPLKGTFARVPATAQLIDTNPPYGVHLDEKALTEAGKKTGLELGWVEIPPRSLGPNQVEPFGSLVSYKLWACHADMDPKLVYEICRVIYENSAKFGDVHAVGKGMVKEAMAAIPVYTEQDFHPGAAKFYAENGIKIGRR